MAPPARRPLASGPATPTATRASSRPEPVLAAAPGRIDRAAISRQKRTTRQTERQRSAAAMLLAAIAWGGMIAVDPFGEPGTGPRSAEPQIAARPTPPLARAPAEMPQRLPAPAIPPADVAVEQMPAAPSAERQIAALPPIVVPPPPSQPDQTAVPEASREIAAASPPPGQPPAEPPDHYLYEAPRTVQPRLAAPPPLGDSASHNAATLPDTKAATGMAGVVLDTPPSVIAATPPGAANVQGERAPSVEWGASAPIAGARLPVEEPELGADRKLALAAHELTRIPGGYDPKYMKIAYPLGDVPDGWGVCSDVIVRAYRGLGIDLQELVHLSRLGTGDTNVDHRRVQVLIKFFAKHGESLPISKFPESYKPGDIVAYDVPWGRTSKWHIAIVTETLSASLRPMVVHNRGYGAKLEDALFHKRIIGHYRIDAKSLMALQSKTPALAATAAVAKPQRRVVARVTAPRS